MRLAYLVIFFLVLAATANAAWETYENDLRNSANSNDVGYFPLKTANFSNDDFGTDFQPLVSDLDHDSSSEVVIFSNNSLIILNPQLDVKSQIKIGGVLGQPTLFNINGTANIVFNARQDSDYFFAYNFYNSTLIQIFNISVSNDLNFSGIKCLNLNGTDSCIFKDKINYVHIINLESKIDNSYYVSANYNESHQTIPAIGDLDNDGNLDAVFWMPSNDGNNYGIFAFDLAAKSVKWKVNTIFSAFLTSYILKGQPVLADLNNDEKLEVAVSVYYDDSFNQDSRLDKFTELFVYDYNGAKLFSRCETNPNLNAGCNSGNYPGREFDGTNPFVIDYDKNGINDICFLKTIDFSYMGIGCYNYSGSEIAEVKLIQSLDGVTETAMAADMNDDGSKEILTPSHIYLLNGTSIFDYNLGKFHPVAVDLDGNDGLDLLWSKDGRTKTFLDNNNYTMDLSVLLSDINFFKFNSTHITVTAVIKNSGQMQANNVKVIIYNTETLDNSTSVFNIRKNGNVTFSSIIPLKEKQKVLVSVDYDNEILESDEINNFAFKEFLGLPFVFVSTYLEPSNIEFEFKYYIKNNLVSGYYTDDEIQADVIVYIGKNNPRNKDMDVNFMNQYNIGYDYGNINYNDKIYSNPFNGLVAAFKEDNQFGKNRVNVMIVGNEIEGDVAATKEFIKNQAIFLNTKTLESVAVDDDNEDAVKVWDYMHSETNKGYYGSATEQFKDIVGHALNDTMISETEHNITTYNNFTLRLRNLKPILSNDFLLYLNSSSDISLPVVMSGGIWSDISSWQDLGSELANNGRDIWLIEITGGPFIECDNCINYNYSDLIDEFWPASIGSVEKLTGKDKIQYVGHSNGCRAALDSLSSWQSTGKSSLGKVIYNGSEILIDMSSNPVDTFVGVGCPGAFSELSYFAKQVNKSGNVAITRLENKNNTHTKFGDVTHELESASGEVAGVSRFFDNPRLSLNLFQQYYDWIHDDKDEQPGRNLQINYFTLIYGTDGFLFSKSNDQIVPVKDELNIYNNIESTNKKLINISRKHTGMTDDKMIKSDVTKSLDKSIYG
ncbi:MAG TPA: CARDB domain-containing protein [Candidatus Nanoarchaeia archaeon]|nr:CARDB domain-containing protein [Candidatus Nanoarchaeia archaeon]